MAADGGEAHAAVAAPQPPAASISPSPASPSPASASPPANARNSTEKAPILPSDDDPASDAQEPALPGHRRADTGKRTNSPGLSAFDRLPDEIVEQILLAADAGAFASLVLLNSKWRSVSQQAHLYAHHLAHCPSYPASSQRLLADRPLPHLRRAFARQVKRCRFAAYLRPNRTLVRLISNSISSSSCPGGEGMQFQPSPRGHHLLAYNSSRIYLLDLRSPDPQVVRELKTLRRPAATCIRDDASVLAVLLTEMQVDLYDLTASPPRRMRSILLDNSPRAIALSPCGSVLAAAYEGGIEVSSLNADALSTDRRSVKCDHVDALAFSFDGTQILGTSVHGAQPNTVILTAPYYDPGSHMSSDDLSALWTTSILFPNTSRDCSHAVLLQDSSREEAFWTFTYDRSFETFRAVRIDDLRNGTTYFTGPVPTANSPARLLPCTLPSASYHGDLVSAAFQGKDIWLYGVPEDLDDVPTPGNNNAPAEPDTSGAASALGSALGGATGAAGNGGSGGNMSRTNSGSPSMRAASARLQDSGNDASVRVPQWQLLCDRLQNTFIAGCRIGELPGVSMVNWVEGFGESSVRERLVVGARGISEPKPVTFDEDDMDFIDGGRLLLVDFDYGVTDGKTTEITIEVGSKEPEVLEEEHRDLDAEVAIVRRRTVAQKKGKTGGALLRNATTAGLGSSATSSMAPPPLPAAFAFSSPQSASRQTRPHPFASSSLRNHAGGTTSDDEQGDHDDPLVPRRIGALSESLRARNQAGVPTPGTLPPLPEAPRNTGAHAARTTGGGGDASGDADEDEDGGETASILEEQMAYDAPYSHASPRSGMTLRRAATAAAVSRRLNPPPATTSTGAPITYRRADGRREHPHESDADNWVPPPPPYQAEVDPQDLPVFLRHNVPPVLAPLNLITPATPSVLPSVPAVPSTSSALPPSTIPGVGATLGVPGLPASSAQTAEASSASAPGSQTHSRANSRPASRESEHEPAGDLYEATPPATPQPPATVPADTERQRPSTALPSPTGNFSSFAHYGMNWGELDLNLDLNLAPRTAQLPLQAPNHGTFVPKPMSSVQTWPVRQPSVSGRGATSPGAIPAGPSLAIPGFAVPASGYPYSAPVQVDQGAAPAPPSSQPPRRTSFQVPRVPVGSHRPNKRSSIGQPLNLSVAVNNPPPALFEFQQLQLQQPQPLFWQDQPPPRAFSNPVVSSSSPLVEDQPLIISTPLGVQGAFDPPRRKKSARGGYGYSNGYGHGHSSSRSLEEPKIIAPVPRHANRHERNAELRERLETISGGGRPAAPAPKPMMNPFLASPYQPSAQSALSSQSQLQAQGLNRKQSRAERSAAKNMADAKKRGWGRSGGKKDKSKDKNKGKGVDDGAATTVGSSSIMSSMLSMPSMPYAAPSVSSQATAVPTRPGRRGKSVAAAVSTAAASTAAASDAPSKGRHTMGKMGKQAMSQMGKMSQVGKKKRRERRERDVDAASSVWTDVTATTGMPGPAVGRGAGPGQSIAGSGSYYQTSQPQAAYYGGMPSIPGGGPGSSSAYAMQQLQQHVQQQRPARSQQQQQHDPVYGPHDKKNKCIVM